MRRGLRPNTTERRVGDSPLSIPVTNRNPVVLIHGIGDTSILFARLCPFLQARGWETHSFNLVPNNGDAALEMLAQQVGSYIESTFRREQTVDLVAFSMGGLVARYYVQRLAGLTRVQRLITISAPHRGTLTAFFRWNAGARQMRPSSDFLQDLNKDKQMLKHIRFTTIWSPLDLIIVPSTSSVMAEARSVRVNVLAHALMMRDRRVLQLVQQALSD
jgi:triacylglycerol lipase